MGLYYPVFKHIKAPVLIVKCGRDKELVVEYRLKEHNMPKILLVEDDLRLREIYSQRLTAEGHEVVEAGDGAQALSALSQQMPDLVIADVMMPNVSGFTMLQTIKTNEATSGIRVILMTALSQPEDKVHGQQLGANRYLVKSQVTLDDLVEVTQEVLKEPPSMATINPDPNPQPAPTLDQPPTPVGPRQ